MRITIVSCVFPPEPVTSARTSADLAARLSDLGHEVHVIAAYPSRPAGRIYPGYRAWRPRSQQKESLFSISRCPSWISAKSSMLSRLLENVSFGTTSALVLLFSGRPDLVYANTWPVLAQASLWLVCQLRGVPLVMSVQDVYPESLVVQQRVQNDRSWLFRALRALDAFIARRTRAVIVISSQFKKFYVQGRGLPADRVHTIPNWLDEPQLMLEEQGDDTRLLHAIPRNAFLVIYGGNVGIAAGIEGVISAFAALADRDIYLLVAGDGALLEHCRSMTAALPAGHVLFHHPWPAGETYPLLRSADLLLLPTRGEQALVSMPSKLISYMLTGRPILALAQPASELARIIRSSGGGWSIPPGDSHRLSQKVVEISRLSKTELGRRGRAGRDFARRHYSRSVNLPKMIEVLESAARKDEHDPLHAAG